MPEIDATLLKKLAEVVLDLKARQEVAEETLTKSGTDLASLEQERKTRLQQLKALPKPAWLLAHGQQVANHDLQEFLSTLQSRR